MPHHTSGPSLRLPCLGEVLPDFLYSEAFNGHTTNHSMREATNGRTTYLSMCDASNGHTAPLSTCNATNARATNLSTLEASNGKTTTREPPNSSTSDPSTSAASNLNLSRLPGSCTVKSLISTPHAAPANSAHGRRAPSDAPKDTLSPHRPHTNQISAPSKPEAPRAELSFLTHELTQVKKFTLEPAALHLRSCHAHQKASAASPTQENREGQTSTFFRNAESSHNVPAPCTPCEASQSVISGMSTSGGEPSRNPSPTSHNKAPNKRSVATSTDDDVMTREGIVNSPVVLDTLFVGMDTKHGSYDASGFTNKLSTSCSDPSLYERIQVMESFPGHKRKDSVSHIRKRSSNPTCGTRRKISATSHPLQRLHGRFYGSRDGQVYPQSYTNDVDVLASEEPDHTSWSQLLASLPEEQRRNSLIRRHHVIVSIPVCVVGKDHPVTFTSFDAIEQTLRRLYPEVVIKKEGVSILGRNGIGTNGDGVADVKLSDPLELTADQKMRRQSVNSLSNRRKMSINTCITTMRTNAQDYRRQLAGVQRVGSFAEEESMNVLFAKSDAISCILEAMKTFPEEEELQVKACSSLLKMASTSESNCVHIVENDGVNVISQTLLREMEKPAILRLVLKTVAFISTAVGLATELTKGGLHSDVLSIMSRHAADREIVRESSFILSNLLVTVDIAHQLMLVGGVHTTISLVDKFPDDQVIQENVCRTLGSFAIFDETCLDVALAGSTAAVLKVMNSQRANVAILESGCWALASLTATETTCQDMVQRHGVDTVLRVLSDYPQEEALQEYGVRVLCNLSCHDSSVKAVSSERVVTLLRQVFKHFPNCVELLEITMVTSSHVLSGHENWFQNLAKSHYILEAAKVMSTFPENVVIQEHGCKLIGNMAVDDNLRKMVEADGASKAVISAMLSLNRSVEIQEVGCLALMNLTADNKDNKIRIKNAGAVPALVHTLNEFHNDQHLVLCALKALGNLVSLEDVCHLLLDENGLGVVVSLADTHKGHVDISIYIALVLAGIANLPDLKQHQAALLDQTLTVIWLTVNKNLDVLLYICQAFENLVKTDAGRHTFVKGNRMTTILTAINTINDNSFIHRSCCKVIAVISLYVETKEQMITEATLKGVLRSMELFPLDVELQIIACGTLSCVVEKIEKLKHEFVRSGGVASIHASVTSHPTEPRLAVVALMVIGHIVPIDENLYPKDAKLAFQTTLFCMKSFLENKEIQTASCGALAKCSVNDESDVLDMVKFVTFALRRHASDPYLQKLAAQVLRPLKRQDNSPALSAALMSPEFKAIENLKI